MVSLGIDDLTEYISYVKENETEDIPLYLAIFMEVNPQVTGYSVIQGALNHIPAFVISLSKAYEIDTVSDFFLKKTSYSKEDISHKNLSEITTGAFSIEEALVENTDTEITFLTKGGEKLEYLCSISG